MIICVEELVDVVADDGIGEKVLKTVPKSHASGALTWVSQVIILNSGGYVLVTQMALDDKKFPGYWEISLTETVRTGEPKEYAAMRGLEEELGIRAKPDLLIPLFPNFYRNPGNTRDMKNAMVFLYHHNGAILPNPEEVGGWRHLLPGQVCKEIVGGSVPYTPMNIRTWEIYMELRTANNYSGGAPKILQMPTRMAMRR